MKKIKPFSEKSFSHLIDIIGSYQYHIYEPSEMLPDGLFKEQLNFPDYNCAFVCTGTTTNDYQIELATIDGTESLESILVPKDQNILVVRLLRRCEHDGHPHYNADDQIIFPTANGCIYRLSRKDAPDHYVELSENASCQSVAEAFALPEEDSGPIDDYKAKGAEIYVNCDPFDEQEKDDEEGIY